jgi:hypothetical protein
MRTAVLILIKIVVAVGLAVLLNAALPGLAPAAAAPSIIVLAAWAIVTSSIIALVVRSARAVVWPRVKKLQPLETISVALTCIAGLLAAELLATYLLLTTQSVWPAFLLSGIVMLAGSGMVTIAKVFEARKFALPMFDLGLLLAASGGVVGFITMTVLGVGMSNE